MKPLRVLFLVAIVAALSVSAYAASISISKEVTPLNPNTYHPGETINYIIEIVNPSPTYTLTINSVTDTLPDGSNGTGDLVGPTPPYILAANNGAPGGADTATYTLAWQVPADANAGLVVNYISAVGVQNSPIPDGASGQAQKTSLLVVPCIDVNKTADPAVSKAGDKVTYTIRICNCGSNALEIVDVNDSILGDLTAYFPATLGIAECNTQEFEYTVQQGDPDPLINEVVVNAIDDTNYPVSDDDDASVNLVHPCLQATKSCQNEPVPPGGSAIFRISITNCGDVALNIVTDENDIPPFTLAAGQTSNQDVSIQADTNDVFNSVLVSATLPVELGLDNVIGPVEANDTCRVEQGGATRTLGFWKTHCEYTEHIFEDANHCNGGPFNLGWVVLDDIGDVLGALFANPAKDSLGNKRDQLCQARVNASRQAVAALLNSCLDNGAPLPKTPSEIATILGGTNIGAIHQLGGILDDYNNSGDDVTIIDGDGFVFGNATPRACAEQANIAAVNCPITTISAPRRR